MAEANVIAYNIAAFISTLFLLEFGADKFIDHTAIVARRTGVSETVIGLLTAGGEWEELAVVIASLARGRSSLSIGNIIGSSISNILGAFSLGLMFYEKGRPIEFDRSSRIYSLLLLVLTTFVIPLTYFKRELVWVIGGAILIAVFGLYIASVGVAIGRGVLTVPEGSDDDSSDEDSSDEESVDVDHAIDATTSTHTGHDEDIVSPNATANTHVDEATPLTSRPSPFRRRKEHSLTHHILNLLLGFLAICLSGYVLSQAATNITDAIGLSDVLFGVIILAIATTLPEKCIAVIGGNRGHTGILVANTAGSNIFLLSLCVGIIMFDSKGALDQGNVKFSELAVLWGSTLAFTVTVWCGGGWGRWIGAVTLGAYLAFIVLEFTVVHSVA